MSSSLEAAPARAISVARDYWTLTKPSINRMCLVEAGGAMFLASSQTGATLSTWHAIVALIGTALAVASANALNMWLERDTDRLMKRTKDRPLAAGRISEQGALGFGIVLGVIASLMLALGTNLPTTIVGVVAILSYVLVYTPMKYKHPIALFVGAIPGAVPPLMGWTAVTGSYDAAGLLLFGILFIWQMPHFLAIAVFRNHDYVAAGIRTVPAVRGFAVARWQAIAWAVLLVPVSVGLVSTGVSGWIYGASAIILGVGFLGFAALPASASPARWAYRLFVASLVYLPVLVLALALDVVLR